MTQQYKHTDTTVKSVKATLQDDIRIEAVRIVALENRINALTEETQRQRREIGRLKSLLDNVISAVNSRG
jgi:predicted  nucleic acid-binding Zn-ribbon protein